MKYEEAKIKADHLVNNARGYFELSAHCKDEQRQQELIAAAQKCTDEAKDLALKYGKLSQLKAGDTIDRIMGPGLVVPLIISKIDEKLIHCGPWKFDKLSGAEVDEELGWGPEFGQTGSWIQPQNK